MPGIAGQPFVEFRARRRAGAVMIDAFLLGVLGARMAHVLWHAGDYLPQPLSAFSVKAFAALKTQSVPA